MSITGNWERRRLSRRDFLAMSGMSATALALGAQGLWLPRSGLAQDSTYPFKLGVASGDPELYDNGSKVSVILWTRLVPGPAFIEAAPLVDKNTTEYKQWEAKLNQLVEMKGDSLQGGQGDPDVGLEVGEVNPTDGSHGSAISSLSVVNPDGSRSSSAAKAEKAFGHSVHAEVEELEPGRRYWYRFTYGGENSQVGYFKTPSTTLTRPLKFAFASCQHWEYVSQYSAYADIAARNLRYIRERNLSEGEELDLVIHLGDYIYEGAPSRNAARRHSAIEQSSKWCKTLFDYRTRHAQYKTDAKLQEAHREHLWLVTWDDHEVENDYAGMKSWYSQSDFTERRAAAYQAYYEHMPLRPRSRTVKDGKVTNVELNRQVTYGNLIQFLVLDTRQFRTEQPCGDQGSLIETSCKDRLQDPISRLNRRHTILGGPTLGTTPGQDAQEIWLKGQGRLTSPPYKWNVLAQQVPMFQYNHYDWTGNWYSESWDSYTAVRERILNHIAQNNVPNAVVITGDMHSSWAANLEKNFNDSTVTDVVGTEFCATSISSGLSTGPGSWDETYKKAFNRTGNKHVKFYNGRNGGYGLCTVDNNRWITEYYLAGSSKPIKTYWVYAKGSVPSGSYGIIDPKTDKPAVPTLSTDA